MSECRTVAEVCRGKLPGTEKGELLPRDPFSLFVDLGNGGAGALISGQALHQREGRIERLSRIAAQISGRPTTILVDAVEYRERRRDEGVFVGSQLAQLGFTRQRLVPDDELAGDVHVVALFRFGPRSAGEPLIALKQAQQSRGRPDRKVNFAERHRIAGRLQIE